MGSSNLIFLELIEWMDDDGTLLARRFPPEGSGEIKFGAQMIVRESQRGVFFYNGKAVHVFEPGRHTLKTANIPILNKILGIPWGLESPLRAEAYLVSTRVFPNLRWGTREPVAFKDKEFGLIRLRAYGVFTIQVIQPLLFINTLVGTMPAFATEAVADFLARVIVSRFNDFMGETLSSILELPGQYDEWSHGLTARLQQDFARYGLGLEGLYINAITPPPEVQKAMDDRTKLGMFSDMTRYLQLKAASALEKAAQNQGGAGEGLGLGVGFMMPSLMAQFLRNAGAVEASTPPSAEVPGPTLTCPECHTSISPHDRFCASCGHQLVVFAQCPSCGKNITPGARFCPRCGEKLGEAKPQPRHCPHCGGENLPNALFCNTCGERLSP